MNQLMNHRVGKPQRSQKRGCLFLIIGSLLALLATVLFILGVSYLIGLVIESRHGGETAYALMSIVTPCYGVAFVLFYGILAVWYITPPGDKSSDPGNRPPLLGQQAPQGLSKRTLWLITAGLLCGVMITGAVCVNTYQLVTPEGIRTYCFAETNRYEWRQVSAYTVDCDDSNGLSVTFTMRDGKQYEILQGINSATDAFHETYTSTAHFATVIDDTMAQLQVPRNVKHVERAVNFYRSYEALWPYVSHLIGYTDIQPEADETVPETESAGETTAAESDPAESN